MPKKKRRGKKHISGHPAGDPNEGRTETPALQEVSEAEETEGISAGQPAASPLSSEPSEAEQADPSVAVLEAPEDAVRRLAGELEETKDKYLRVAAEFDNFRKRIARERGEIRTRGQLEVVAALSDALDDLGRVAHLDPEQTSANDVISGVELVERKMLRELQSAGLERVGEPGDVFDPNLHEAVGTRPAESAAQDQVIAAVVQPGYKFCGALVRAARVHVHIWQGDREQRRDQSEEGGP